MPRDTKAHGVHVSGSLWLCRPQSHRPQVILQLVWSEIYTLAPTTLQSSTSCPIVDHHHFSLFSIKPRAEPTCLPSSALFPGSACKCMADRTMGVMQWMVLPFGEHSIPYTQGVMRSPRGPARKPHLTPLASDKVSWHEDSCHRGSIFRSPRCPK